MAFSIEIFSLMIWQQILCQSPASKMVITWQGTWGSDSQPNIVSSSVRFASYLNHNLDRSCVLAYIWSQVRLCSLPSYTPSEDLKASSPSNLGFSSCNYYAPNLWRSYLKHPKTWTLSIVFPLLCSDSQQIYHHFRQGSNRVNWALRNSYWPFFLRVSAERVNFFGPVSCYSHEFRMRW